MKVKKVIISMFLVLLLLILVVGVTYAVFNFSSVGEVENAIRTGAVTMVYNDGDNEVTINNAVPMADEVGKVLSDEDSLFDFTVSIDIVGNADISYEITAEKNSSSTLSDSDIRLYLQRSLDGTNYNEEILQPGPYVPMDDDDDFGAKEGEMVLDVGTTNKSVFYYYRLRMWVASDYEDSQVSRSFAIKVKTYGKSGSYTKKVEGEANAPKLAGDMIPVIYDDASDSWQKSSTKAGEWYDYNNQKWANVVTIKDSTKRADYKEAAVGTSIAMEDINTFMVWIPRYSYTLGNTYGYQIDGASTPSKATPGAFDIKFVSKSTTEFGSGQYTGDTPENYFTPSSFCWGDTCDDEATRKDSGNRELSGIWVAKFELTGTIDDISSLPSKESLKNQNLAVFFNEIQGLMNGTSGATNYGLSGTYDTHLIKNTEWGAFAYLSQSKYGKYGNKNYSGADKEVAINNCSSYITGIGADSVSGSGSNTTCTTNTYKTVKGQAASTTGNIYGIYDTSGGTAEIVMGNYNNMTAAASFSSLPARRYFNLYTGAVGIKGDATNADGVNGFYNDSFSPPSSSIPWGARGGFYMQVSSSGIFTHDSTGAGGGASSMVTTRFACITR